MPRTSPAVAQALALDILQAAVWVLLKRPASFRFEPPIYAFLITPEKILIFGKLIIMDLTYFSTMAQLAGVLVGFANLANAIYRPNIQAKEFLLNKVRILTSTELGLVNIIICVLPILFHSTAIPQLQFIKVLSGLLVIVLPLYGNSATNRALKLMGTRFPVPFFSKLYFYSGFFGGAMAALNVFEIFGSTNVLFVYELITFICFLLQAFLFIRLIHWILSTQEVNR